MDDRLSEALDIVVARTGHARFRDLCDESHPAYNPAVAAEVMRMAGFAPPLPPDPPGPPALLTRAANFASAVVMHASAGMPTLGGEASGARLAVCRSCPRFLAPNTCAVCGCSLSFKASWADQHCPEGRWPGDPVSAAADIGPG